MMGGGEYMWKEFREFALKGSMIDLAIGIIIGAAFGKVITSLVNDVIMPPIGLLLGKVDFSSLYLNLSGKDFVSMQEAIDAGAPILKYGLFVNTLIEFFIIAFVIFIVVKNINNLRKKEAEKEPETKECQYCLSSIPIKATRCPNCTSELL
jgi:large conductance mechanosensitive channel